MVFSPYKTRRLSFQRGLIMKQVYISFNVLQKLKSGEEVESKVFECDEYIFFDVGIRLFLGNDDITFPWHTINNIEKVTSEEGRSVYDVEG
jgi:hypothetical protein